MRHILAVLSTIGRHLSDWWDLESKFGSLAPVLAPVMSQTWIASRMALIWVHHCSDSNIWFTPILDLAGSEMKFDTNGDGMGRYNIFNYQQNPIDRSYSYVTVGRWTDLGLELNQEKLRFNEGSPNVPTSICSQPCHLGEIKIVQAGDNCCWICQKCEPWAFMKNESHCEDCGEGRWPDKDKTGCYDLTLQYMQWDSLFAIIPIVIACFGILLTLFVIFTFIKYNDTPIVKASGRELSFILLGGIMFCYLNTFILLTKPTTFVCAAQRFGVCLPSVFDHTIPFYIILFLPITYRTIISSSMLRTLPQSDLFENNSHCFRRLAAIATIVSLPGNSFFLAVRENRIRGESARTIWINNYQVNC